MRQKVANIVIAGVVVVVVAGLVVFGLLRTGGHHEEPAPKAEEKQLEHGAANVHEHAVEGGEAELPPSGAVEDGVRVVKVTARQFVFVPNQIVVKLGEKVRLEVTSQDITHGIEMKDYGINRKLNPKQTETIEFFADKPGRHHFNCSVYCGDGHENMHGELVVVE